MTRLRLLVALLMGLWSVVVGAADSIDIEPFIARSQFGAIKISPTGAYYAVTVRLPDRTALVVLRRSDMQAQAKVTGAVNSTIAGFWWVNDERIVVAMADQLGTLETPQLTGELHGVNADGSGARLLVGHTDGAQRAILGDFSGAYLIDDLPDDDRYVLIARADYGSADPLTRVERMNVYNGKRKLVARAPVRSASFVTDRKGEVRFAVGVGHDSASRLYYRDDGRSDWRLINDENASGRGEWALGFAVDGQTAVLETEQAQGPNAIVGWNPATDARRELARDPRVDPFEVVSDGRHGLIAVRFTDAKVRTLHFDADSDAAQTQQRLERSFPDSAVRITSTTTDGMLSVLQVSSDRDPGSYFLYNHAAKKADFIFSVSSLDPAAMAAVRGVNFKARDGLDLHGFLTRPSGANGAGPLVLLVHGGPISIFDRWEFDLDSQLLAKAGYSVLRVNYRGSGNYGRAYTHAGAREWGGRMQDDLDDAVRWAIAEGIADPERIAIVGGSYGGYAALMGVARTPELYKCAVGYVGVYDLELMVDDDKNSARWIGNWLEEWVGDDELLRARSPTRLAAGIKAPVLLVAGHEDWIAPIEHSRRMERALKKAGADVETLYVDREGHGFYAEANRRAYYRRLLTFLHRHLGGAVAN